jgi:hypothetical protein
MMTNDIDSTIPNSHPNYAIIPKTLINMPAMERIAKNEMNILRVAIVRTIKANKTAMMIPCTAPSIK